MYIEQIQSIEAVLLFIPIWIAVGLFFWFACGKDACACIGTVVMGALASYVIVVKMLGIS